MHIAIVVHRKVPVSLYGGTERIAYWLIDELLELGHQVTLLAPKGSSHPRAKIINVPIKNPILHRYIPKDVDVVHIHTPAAEEGIETPYLYTLHGNVLPWKPWNRKNVVCISADHARRHNKKIFVYNGIDPDEYIYQEEKQDYILFFSKVSRRVKGIKYALAMARCYGFKMKIGGGRRWNLRKPGGFVDSLFADVEFLGELGGERKAKLIANAKALLFPIQWEEPFGLVVIEAMMSGTPVITVPRGSMPELITPDVGFVCNNETEMMQAINNLDKIKPAACRQRAMQLFTMKHCAQNYLNLYERIIAGEEV